MVGPAGSSRGGGLGGRAICCGAPGDVDIISAALGGAGAGGPSVASACQSAPYAAMHAA